MEPLETLLRERFSVPAAGAPADIDDLIRTARHRRRTRNLAVGTTAIAAFVAGGLALVAALHGSIGDGHQPAAAHRASVASPQQVKNLVKDSYFWFTDSSHGYGTITRCPTGIHNCNTTYESTTDGGATFTPMAVPAAARNGRAGQLYVFNKTKIAIGIPTMGTASWWISSDVGRTWSKEDDVVYGPTDQVPAGALVVSQGAGSPTLVVFPDGTRHKLATAPHYSDPEPSGFMIGGVAAGPLFANMENGHLRVSADRGATWHPSNQAVTASKVTVLGTDGERIFAVTSGEGSLDHLLVSSDNGRTFTKVATPMVKPPTKKELPSDGGLDWTDPNSFAMAGSSVIMTNGSGQLWRLAPGATSFNVVKTPKPVIGVAGSGTIATVQMGTKLRRDIEFTADGTHFTASPLQATDQGSGN